MIRLTLSLWLGLAGLALAHDGEDHSTQTASDLGPKTALPWEVGGPFELLDQNGQHRSQSDPEGHHQLLFFGYANCPGICSAALPMMAQIAQELTESGINTRPVMITIDPTLDTVETMGPALGKISSDFVGLTGTKPALQVAYDAYQIRFEKIADDLEYGPIYAHSSHIYLLDPSGEVLTLLPPVIGPQDAIRIVEKYAKGS